MKKAIIKALKDLGVKEVTIDVEGEYIEFSGENNGEYFVELFDNRVFSEEGL
jgi:hypothetical protein